MLDAQLFMLTWVGLNWETMSQEEDSGSETQQDNGGADEELEQDVRLDDIDVSVDRRTFLKLSGLGALGAAGALSMQRLNIAGMGQLGPTGHNVVCDVLEGVAGENGDGDGPPETDGDDSVAEENEQDGDTGWEPSNMQPGDIEAYTMQDSIEPGDTLECCVSAGGSYRIEIYRVGWYGGDGGRQITSVEGSSPQDQPQASPAGQYDMVECDWDVTDEIDDTGEWTTGLYYAWFIREDGGASYAHPFVVRPSSPSADIVVQLPMTTQQAYNNWPGEDSSGKSLYDFNSSGSRSSAVSFHRPYQDPFDWHLNYALHFVRFAEEQGYSVEYVSGTDVDENPEMLQDYRIAVSCGHDEYCSANQYDAFMDARDNGTHLMFLGGNIFYWRVFYHDDGTVMECEKIDSNDLFRNTDRPEVELLGTISWGSAIDNHPDLHVDEDGLDHEWMDGTGFEEGDRVAAIVGPEWDWTTEDSPEHTRFFYYEEGMEPENTTGGDGENDEDCDIITYEADSGAVVFSGVTNAWTVRIDSDPSWNNEFPLTQVAQSKSEANQTDERLQQFQENVFDDMLSG